MKNTWQKTTLGAMIAAGVALSAGAAGAGAFVHGTICQVNLDQTGYSLNLAGVNATRFTTVFCPSPVDHDLGASLQWQTRIFDGSTNDEVRCTGVALDSSGGQVGATSPTGSGTAFTGGMDLLYTFTASVGSPSYSYVTQCNLPSPGPAGGSTVKTIRVF